jgi:hypothetical protein
VDTDKIPVYGDEFRLSLERLNQRIAFSTGFDVLIKSEGSYDLIVPARQAGKGGRQMLF